MFAGNFTHYELGRINPTGEVFERLISLKPLGRWAEGKSLEEYAPVDGTRYWHLIYHRE